VIHDLACEQGPHDVHALAQPCVPLGLRRPRLAGDVLVGRLAGAERDPQAPREQLAQRRRGLGDDRRVIALTRRVDDAERQLRRLKRRTEEGPGEAGFALTLAPRREVVGRHRGAKAGGLGLADVLQQAARRDLLMRTVQADDRHECSFLPVLPAAMLLGARHRWTGVGRPRRHSRVFRRRRVAVGEWSVEVELIARGRYEGLAKQLAKLRRCSHGKGSRGDAALPPTGLLGSARHCKRGTRSPPGNALT
jgi:hypothetical protein